jgi:hypothetical protein
VPNIFLLLYIYAGTKTEGARGRSFVDCCWTIAVHIHGSDVSVTVSKPSVIDSVMSLHHINQTSGPLTARPERDVEETLNTKLFLHVSDYTAVVTS